jgi:hypothetical protein
MLATPRGAKILAIIISARHGCKDRKITAKPKQNTP